MKNSKLIYTLVLSGSPLMVMTTTMSQTSLSSINFGHTPQMGVVPTPSALDEAWCKATQNVKTISVTLNSLDEKSCPTELNLQGVDFSKLSLEEKNKLKSFFCSDRVLYLQLINIENAVGISQFIDMVTDSDKLANLRTISVQGSDINLHDLYEFYRDFSSTKPFIRDISMMSSRSGQYIAQLSFRGFPSKLSYADLNALESPKDTDVPIYFRAEKQFCEGAFKLQITD